MLGGGLGAYLPVHELGTDANQEGAWGGLRAKMYSAAKDATDAPSIVSVGESIPL